MVSRQDLVNAQDALAAGRLDVVRAAVKNTITPMTIKGYFGDSVKARIVDLKEAGKDTGPLSADRMAVLKSLNTVDTYCYAKQTNGDAAAPEVAADALKSAIAALDSVVKRL